MEGDKPAAEKTHHTRSYERYCPDSGDANNDYKAPNVFCKDCDSPWGTITDENSAEFEKTVKNCWNCGGTEGRMKEE